jgi:hypothetical protein
VTDVFSDGVVPQSRFANSIYDNITSTSHWTSTPYIWDFTSDGDPFVDASGGDYRSALGAGTIDGIGKSGPPVYDTEISLDIIGNSISGASDIDIGPFNYGGGNYNWTDR